MLDQLQNDGMEVLNWRTLDRYATIIVVGVPRSGTTMAAKALEKLGVFLGSEIDAPVQEDQRLSRALESATGELSDVILAYNNAHEIWGFKRPTAYQTIDLSLFRHPRLVVTFRDPLAIAKREQVSMVSDFRDQLRRATEWSAKLADFALRQSVPTMLISYEKALQRPERFVRGLSRFIGMQPDDVLLRAAVDVIRPSPSEYVTKSQVRFPQV